jgi:predicted 3-demethylubiquinone-9 3-methyltransferase (glyoxalase superfamily)
MQNITPFLWFDDKAEEAANFYVSIFPNSRVKNVNRNPVVVSFELNGQDFLALDGGPKFSFTPAISLLVNCDSQEEVDRYWEKLTAGGGKPDRCGWLTDKYGLSWQIIPTELPQLIQHPKALQAMLQMDKIDLEALRRAAHE